MESFYNMLKHAHSGLRWVVLILLIYAIYNAFAKKKGTEYTEGDRKLNLFTMVSAHTMLLIGLIMYFMNPFIHLAWGHMGEVMHDSAARHMVIEHPIGMLLALVLITIGHSKSKKAIGGDKHKKIFTFYLIGLIIILASIPWPFRFEGAGWF
jgi:4-hydroxybenzoate polyprenyltransferase